MFGIIGGGGVTPPPTHTHTPIATSLTSSYPSFLFTLLLLNVVAKLLRKFLFYIISQLFGEVIIGESETKSRFLFTIITEPEVN
jgi:hypothetical protein